MRHSLVIAAVLATLAGVALAEAPEVSPRPIPRPGLAPVVALPPVSEVQPVASLLLRPMARPALSGGYAPALAGISLLPAGLSHAPLQSPRPTPRLSGRVELAAAIPARPGKPGARGTVCGDPDLQGVAVPPIPGKVAGCGLTGGVRITAVSGVSLSQPATVDCTTAKALKTWVETGILPAVGRTGGGLARLEIAASYVCRPRNNQPGAKVSEHGRGRAVDLAGLRLANGEVISVLRGFRSHPRVMKAVERSACGTFGTVLGPKADRYHQDHIHVDTARHRNGSYCK
ncbi:hypothetical protein CCR83_03595 [Rhodobacter veldkampii DSM 11550]|uniref:Extensin-like protein n=1 Tax=Phaeovulum veldkampii DSM 11550 TaxID=1185920 RepID=A0A2T4JI13_9RHOB|nr:extensin family protein [Phaeovulum veldkampii]MBK5945556.1 hypothetical protein [Phaeovulum veldkampii DSM 11550]PTE17550.1 extensin-like protein [Phaeovulum veldkampii DSM 11550]TDQ60286.1 hypothetical protein EV658_10564 [Phaeovulum veldkampii DSM 11550]